MYKNLVVRELFGVAVHATTEEEMVDVCDGAIQSRERLNIGVVNAAKMVNMRRQPLLRASVLGSDVVLADGMSIVWASRILGRPLPARVNGTNLFEKLLALADRRQYGVYFLGAAEEVLDEMCRRVEARYPRLRVVGSHDGFFSEEEEDEIAADIRRSRPDLLFVGITSPKKEIFLARWGSEMDVPVCHGVGGSFDVLAGKVRRAPRAWQRAGLEWLFRTLQEPRRLWKRYLVTNSIFIWMVVSELVRTGLTRDGARM